MKLYDFEPAPSGHRVRVFLAEKGIALPIQQLNVRADDQFSEPFTSMNPFHCIPFLELDDGTVIAESVSICRYLEELHPEPSLFGRTAIERAVIDMWHRRVEIDGFMPGVHAVRNKVPMFAGKVLPGTRSDIPQREAIVERGIEMQTELLGKLDKQLSTNDYIAGSSVSIADITGWFTVTTASRLGIDVEQRFPSVQRWHQAFSSRPSTQSE